MNWNDLPLADRQAAAAVGVETLFVVAREIYTNPAYGNTRTTRELFDSLARCELPSWGVLARVSGWIVFETAWTSRFRPLTPTEITAHLAAQRLSLAIWAERHNL